jgi:cytochrome P450
VSRKDLPPGPPYPTLIQGLGQWTRPLAYLERCRARYGNRFTIQFPFTEPFVMHADPAHIKEIYTAPPDVLRPGEGARVLEPIVGTRSVILLDGDAHMTQRKLMLPAFHGEKMDRLRALVETVTERELAAWPREPVLHPLFQSLTLEIILRAVFGFDDGPTLDSTRTALARLLKYGDSPLTLIPGPVGEDTRTEEGQDWVFRMLNRAGPLRGFLDVRAEVDRRVFELIAERRDAGEDRDDVLSMLLAARHEDGTPMSDEELRDELMTLLVAGHETTATTLAWAFERLAREPAARSRLAEEVSTEDDGPYLTATIQETLRRRPVLPNTAPRAVKKPIEVGGWHYEPGASLVASSYLVHHDPDIYPDPYAFRPERFIDSPPGTYSWIPFGGGRRRCLGASFALLEMKVVIASAIRAFDFGAAGAAHEVPRRRNITIRPARGSRVVLEPRTSRVPAAA